MPAKTKAFTNHVVPNSSANWTTLFVSKRRNADPELPKETVAPLSGSEESDPDPKKTTEQNEVREVREVHHIRSRPPDQGELRE
jgi:hypothetical protein